MEADGLPVLIAGDGGQSNGYGFPDASVQHCLMLPPSLHAIHAVVQNALGDRLRDENAPILVHFFWRKQLLLSRTGTQFDSADHGRK